MRLSFCYWQLISTISAVCGNSFSLGAETVFATKSLHMVSSVAGERQLANEMISNKPTLVIKQPHNCVYDQNLGPKMYLTVSVFVDSVSFVITL